MWLWLVLANLICALLNLLVLALYVPTVMTLASLGMDRKPVSGSLKALQMLVPFLMYAYPVFWLLSLGLSWVFYGAYNPLLALWFSWLPLLDLGLIFLALGIFFELLERR